MRNDIRDETDRVVWRGGPTDVVNGQTWRDALWNGKPGDVIELLPGYYAPEPDDIPRDHPDYEDYVVTLDQPTMIGLDGPLAPSWVTWDLAYEQRKLRGEED